MDAQFSHFPSPPGYNLTMTTAYLVLETVMFEGSTLRGAYSNPDAADNHLQALRATEEVTGYVYFTVEEWELKDVYTPTIRRS